MYAWETNAATARLRVMQIQGSKRQLVPLSSEIAVETGLLKRPEISVSDMIIAAPVWSAGARNNREDNGRNERIRLERCSKRGV